MKDMNRTVLYDNEDGVVDKQGGERKRSIVISTSWDTGVKEVVVLTMVAHPNTGYGAVLQQLSTDGKSEGIVLYEDGLETLAEELTRWVQRHRTIASAKGM